MWTVDMEKVLFTFNFPKWTKNLSSWIRGAHPRTFQKHKCERLGYELPIHNTHYYFLL